MLRSLTLLALSAFAANACSEPELPPPAQEPAESEARADSPEEAANAALVPVSATPSDPSEVLFGLETREHQVYIHSTDHGSLYTVKSKDGRVLADRISEVELGVSYPDLHDILNNGIDLIGTGSDQIDH